MKGAKSPLTPPKNLIHHGPETYLLDCPFPFPPFFAFLQAFSTSKTKYPILYILRLHLWTRSNETVLQHWMNRFEFRIKDGGGCDVLKVRIHAGCFIRSHWKLKTNKRATTKDKVSLVCCLGFDSYLWFWVTFGNNFPYIKNLLRKDITFGT